MEILVGVQEVLGSSGEQTEGLNLKAPLFQLEYKQQVRLQEKMVTLQRIIIFPLSEQTSVLGRTRFMTLGS